MKIQNQVKIQNHILRQRDLTIGTCIKYPLRSLIYINKASLYIIRLVLEIISIFYDLRAFLTCIIEAKFKFEK